MEREIRLLWTGGWDSTFRLLRLSREEGLTIRPLYIRDHARKGMVYELGAMCEILSEVRAIAKARVSDVELYDRGAILHDYPDERISAAYSRLAEVYGLGYQYELFALLCKGLGVRAECCVEDSERSKAKAVIDAQCRLVPCEDVPLGGAVRQRVAPSGKDTDGEIVFGCLDFGSLGVSKTAAQRLSRETGWMPIMRKTWFCHMPVNGRPCGICNPCKDALAEGMGWRLPLSAHLRRYREAFRAVLRRAR